MSSSIAGATTTGQVADNQVANNILSHKPLAILARVLQLKGATTITSAQRPNITWFDQDSLLTSSVMTAFLDNVARVSGDTNAEAAGVITTFTSAPAFTSRRTSKIDLYAAILPVTASNIFLSWNIMG